MHDPESKRPQRDDTALSASDFIEFVMPEDDKPQQVSRFGQGERYEAHFRKLAEQYAELRSDAEFVPSLDHAIALSGHLRSPLLHAKRLSAENGGAQIYLKREDLAPSHGALRLNVMGSALTAQRLGKTTLVTGIVRGKCALVTASVAAQFGMRAVIFVDDLFAGKHPADMMRMKLMGARVNVIDSKSIPHDDIRIVALEQVIRNEKDAFLVMGLEAAPQPYALMLQDFSGVIGRDAVRQLAEQASLTPRVLAARGTGHPDGIGFLSAFLDKPDMRLVCVEVRSELAEQARVRAPSGEDPYDPAYVPLTDHQKRLASGILHQQEFVSVGREHAALKATGRIEYVQIDDQSAKKAITDAAQLEGYVSPVETAQVLAWLQQTAKTMPKDQAVIALIAEDAEHGVWDVGRVFGM